MPNPSTIAMEEEGRGNTDRQAERKKVLDALNRCLRSDKLMPYVSHYVIRLNKIDRGET